MNKLRMQSLDVIGSNIQKIQHLFPNCVTERLGKDGKPELCIDFDKLQAELSNDIIGEGEERYQFTWPDKRAANRLANTPTTMTLRPCREESVDFDHTQNLYIEGDNLDVLKVLRETYLGKVKMIYIDPPYNTGNDFVYNDDFTQNYTEFAESCKVYDEDGNLQYDPKANGESNGRFHTDWLNMIYPRIKVARDLLSDDGVIFISIDDNEVENLRKVCDEIFGEQNSVAQLVIENNPRGRQSDTFFATSHEYLLCFAKNINTTFIKGMPLTEEQVSDYKFEDKSGKYRLLGLRQRGVASLREDRPEMFFPIWVNPQTNDISLTYVEGWERVIPKKSDGREGRWMWGKQKCKNDFNRLVARHITSRNEFDIFIKDYLNKGDEQRTRKYKTIWSDKSLNNQIGTQEVKALLEGDYMPFPKSTEYIKSIIQMASAKDSIILDFFSGSATTAHAVMQLNAEDGGNCKFIMVQLPELTDEKSEAYKAGYKNICEIGKERIRRAGKKILTNVLSGEGRADGTGYGVGMDNYDEYFKATGDKVLDIGFRVLRLDSSNMENVYYTPQEFDADLLFNENVKADRTSEDLLFQVMLNLGIELSAKIETRQIAGKTVHIVDEKYLAACFDRDVNETTITEIAKLHPVYFVMRDASAANDNVIDNFEQIFRHYSPDTNCRIL